MGVGPGMLNDLGTAMAISAGGIAVSGYAVGCSTQRFGFLKTFGAIGVLCGCIYAYKYVPSLKNREK